MVIENPIQRCVDELRRIVELPNTQNLSSGIHYGCRIIQLGYISTREQGSGGVGYKNNYSRLYLTSKGLKERVGYGDYVFAADGFPWDEDWKDREISLNEFEAMISKYSITEKTLQETRAKLEKQ